MPLAGNPYSPKTRIAIAFMRVEGVRVCKPETLNPNPKPQTLNPKPGTLNPKPKPQTLLEAPQPKSGRAKSGHHVGASGTHPPPPQKKKKKKTRRRRQHISQNFYMGLGIRGLGLRIHKVWGLGFWVWVLQSVALSLEFLRRGPAAESEKGFRGQATKMDPETRGLGFRV